METTIIDNIDNEKELTFEEMYPSDEDDEYMREVLKNKNIDYNSDDYDNLPKINSKKINLKKINLKKINSKKNIDITKDIFKKDNVSIRHNYKYYFNPRISPIYK